MQAKTKKMAIYFCEPYLSFIVYVYKQILVKKSQNIDSSVDRNQYF